MKEVVDIVIKKGFQPTKGKVNIIYKKDGIELSVWKVGHGSIELEFNSSRKIPASAEDIRKSIEKYMCIESLHNDDDGFYLAGVVYDFRVYKNVEQVINHVLKFKGE